MNTSQLINNIISSDSLNTNQSNLNPFIKEEKFKMTDLGKFFNSQDMHYVKTDLNDMRPIKRIFGTFDTTDDSITKARVTIKNNKELFLLLHKQLYEKLANNSIKTYAIGQELNNIRKIVIDIDFVSDNDNEHEIFSVFSDTAKILEELFDCKSIIYARHPNIKNVEVIKNIPQTTSFTPFNLPFELLQKINSIKKDVLPTVVSEITVCETVKKYKYGCHIILDKYINSDLKLDRDNTYEHIIRDARIQKFIEKYGNNFIDKAVFNSHQIFWIYGGNKNGSNPYLELDRNTLQLINPYKKFIDMGMSFEQFVEANPDFDFSVPLYDSFENTDFEDKLFVPPEYIKEQERKSTNTNYNNSNISLEDIEKLLSMIDYKETENYRDVRFKIIAALACEFNHSPDIWYILKDYLQQWNIKRGFEADYHMNLMERTYFSGSDEDREDAPTIGTLFYFAKLHSPEEYEIWNNTRNTFDNSILEGNDIWSDDDDYTSITSNEVCSFSPLDEKTENIGTKEKAQKTQRDTFLAHHLNKIVENRMKKAYESLTEYENDRKQCIKDIFNYAKLRFFCMANPINTVVTINSNNDISIDKTNDIVRTYKSFGTIPGVASYFPEIDPEIKKMYKQIDAVTLLTESPYRKIYSGVDFMPYNSPSIERIFYRDGSYYVNSFTGYNPRIYTDSVVPDLSYYDNYINDFINNNLGNPDGIPAPFKLDQEQLDFINKHPVFMKPFALTLLNIAGGVEYANYVEKVIAQEIQEPDNLLPVAQLFYSICRQGKGFMEKTIAEIVGQKYCVEVNSREEFDGTHRTPFENTLNVFINEANATNWGKNSIDTLKSHIDGKKELIANRKCIQEYKYTTRSRVWVFTNNINGFMIDIENGNGRFNVFKACNFIPVPDVFSIFLNNTVEIFRKYDWYYKGLYEYFNNIQYTEAEIRKIYETDYMKIMREADKSYMKMWIEQLSTDETIIEYYKTERIKERIHIMSIDDGFVTANQLRNAFCDWLFKNNIDFKVTPRWFRLEMSKYPDVFVKRERQLNHTNVYNINISKCDF